MFYSLPEETVFEAKRRTRRATFYFFILLVFLYVVFLDLLAVAVHLFFALWLQAQFPEFGKPGPPSLLLPVEWGTPLAALLAVFHFFSARNKRLEDLLSSMGAKPADPHDSYHLQFINLVGEAEAATGIHGIRPVVLSSPGCNAFSLQDGQGQSAIGVTDGLLSKLTRPELSAVVAHEAAHLVHEDSKLVTTACFLFGFFGSTNEALSQGMKADLGSDGKSSTSSGTLWAAVLILWIISGIGYFITKLVFMAISREREYLADADGVAMCKDPLSLAESLYKISRRFRGGLPNTYASLFIMNPQDSEWDESEGFFPDLFSDHPPVSRRISKLLGWAKADIGVLQDLDRKEEAADKPGAVKEAEAPDEGRSAPAAQSPGPTAPSQGFLAYQGNQWVGPYQPDQLLAMGLLEPATWVCPAGSQNVMKASEASLLTPLFQSRVQGGVPASACPRCKVSLLPVNYEGSEAVQCSFCKGYLLGAGVLERIITREEKTFTAEEIHKARVWRDSQRGTLKERDSYPEIKCPLCQSLMAKGIHSMLTQVVVDHCSNLECGAVWCDGGELETIQMMVEDAHKAK